MKSAQDAIDRAISVLDGVRFDDLKLAITLLNASDRGAVGSLLEHTVSVIDQSRQVLAESHAEPARQTYSVAVSAVQEWTDPDNVNVFIGVSTVEAGSTEEAASIGLDTVRKEWPSREGWKDHQSVASSTSDVDTADNFTNTIVS